MKIKHLLAYSLAASLFSSASFAQSVTTDPVGVVTQTILSGSDNFFGVPLKSQSDLVGSVGGVEEVAGQIVINIDGSAALETDSYADGFFLRFRDGSLQGQYFEVIGNSGNSLTIDSLGQDFSSVAVGDAFDVQRFWTLSTLFPVDSTPLTASIGTAAFQRRSVVILPDIAGDGVNRAPIRSFFFTASGGWVENTSGFPNSDDVIIHPDSFVIIRQPASLSDIDVSVAGAVDMAPLASFLSSRVDGSQDNFIAINRPVPVTLADSGIADGITPSLGNAAFQRRDTVFILDNDSRGFNRAGIRSFFVVGGEWRENVSGFPNSDEFELRPGATLLIRRTSTVDGSTSVVINQPNY